MHLKKGVLACTWMFVLGKNQCLGEPTDFYHETVPFVIFSKHIHQMLLNFYEIRHIITDEENYECFRA